MLSHIPAGALTTNTAQEATKLTPTTGTATTYTYNGNGSRTGSTTGTSTIGFTWAANGSLATVMLPGTGGTITYTSDGAGLRQSRKLGTTTTKYLWSHLTNLPMLLDDGTNSYLYGPAGQVIEQIIDSSQTVQYLFHDLLGSVRLITSSTGTTAGTYTYDPYGKQTGHTGTSTSGLGYTGNLTDVSTGLLYLRARDYDPGTGQFLSADPLVSITQQLYAYASNNPLLNTDVSGLWDGWDTLAVIGIGLATVALAITGVGAIVEISAAVAAAGVVAGVAGTAIDAVACANGDGLGCGGMVFDAFATGGGLAAILLDGGSMAAGLSLATLPYALTGWGLDLGSAWNTIHDEYEREDPCD